MRNPLVRIGLAALAFVVTALGASVTATQIVIEYALPNGSGTDIWEPAILATVVAGGIALLALGWLIAVCLRPPRAVLVWLMPVILVAATVLTVAVLLNTDQPTY